MSVAIDRWRALPAVAACTAAAALVLITAGGPHAQNEAPLFEPVAAVLQNPRCLNCHSRGDTPGNGEDGHPHLMHITRGPDDFGAPGARCRACHRDENSEMTIVPGAEGWSLAPRSMGWVGLSKGELCATLKDPKANGGRDLAALVKHLETDGRVLWAWNPGKGRAPVPVPHAEFMRQFKAWADAGGPCPAS